ILEALMLHHMAPVARRIADGEKDGPLLLLCATQRLRSPREPVHGIVLVLQQVRDGFAGEAVGQDKVLDQRIIQNGSYNLSVQLVGGTTSNYSAFGPRIIAPSVFC